MEFFALIGHLDDGSLDAPNDLRKATLMDIRG